MLSSVEISEVKFSKSMGGYNREEVEVFLDKVESDYVQFERIISECKEEIRNYQNELKDIKASHDNIQNVLISAQGLADKIVSEAKEKSEEIIRNAERNISVISEREKELSEAFELNAQQRKEALEKELTDMVREAQLKADSINAATKDSIARQQMLFDKLKFEITAFKASINDKYKEHLESLSQIPNSVPNDPKYLAEMVSVSFDKAPAPEDFISKSPKFIEAEKKIDELQAEEEIAEAAEGVEEAAETVLEAEEVAAETEETDTEQFPDGFKVLI